MTNKIQCVTSVEEPVEQPKSSVSITAMPQERCADCCASLATGCLDTQETKLKYSREPLNTSTIPLLYRC